MSVFTLTDPAIAKLVAISTSLRHLQSIAGLLAWDQETYLPPKGAYARAGQIETLAKLIHQRSTAASLRRLLEQLAERIEYAPNDYTDHDKALVRVMARDFRLASTLSKKLVGALSRHTSLSLEVWRHARTQNSFAVFEKSLSRMIELKREVAYSYGFAQSPYDALLQEYEVDLTSARVGDVFDTFLLELSPLVDTLVELSKDWKTDIFAQHFDPDRLLHFTVEILEQLGFDLQSGRQDQSTHPFTIGLTPQDVRVTTRVLETNPLSTILSSIHEGGHGMYEQGVAPEIAATRLGVVDSLVLHESQSRFFENMIGKSAAFWQYLHPRLLAVFPTQLAGTSASDAWRAVNRVSPSLIRVDADEVTYHFHIIIRTQIERDLIEGTLAVSDVPERWAALYQQYLHLQVPDDLHGALQDIHWSQGLIGYFPTYSLGSFLAVQLFDTIQHHHPSLSEDIAKGKFEPIRSWLAAEIHANGSMFSSEATTLRLTGKNLGSTAFITAMKQKFGLHATHAKQ